MSLLPLLMGKGNPDRDAIFWHYPHYGNQGGFPGGVIRMGDWKLIEFYEDNRIELYNLKEDPGEQHDLAGPNMGGPPRSAPATSRLRSGAGSSHADAESRLTDPLPLRSEGGRKVARLRQDTSWLLRSRLGRHDRKRQDLGPSEDPHRDLDSHALLGEQPVQVVDAADGVPVKAEDQVALLQSRPLRGSTGIDDRPPARRRGAREPFRSPRPAGRGTVWTAMPMRARRTRPSRIKRPATNLAVLIAIAKQIPCAGRIMAVLTPMTLPRESTSGPPELPGFRAASVWSTSSMGRGSGTGPGEGAGQVRYC